MSFLQNTYKPFTLKWIVQRIILVFREGRLPQFKVLSKNKKELSGNEEIVVIPELKTIEGPKIQEAILPIEMMQIVVPEEIRNKHLINAYFDCIYLLNLKHRSDKRLKSIFQLKQWGIGAWIVYGINGYESPHKENYERYASIPLYEKDAHPLEFKIGRKCISSPGAWGVLLSKKMILQHAIKNGYKRILLLQDDLFYIEEFHQKFEEFIELINDDWKLIQLGASQFKWKIPEHFCYHDPSITTYDPSQKFYHPLVSDGAFALGVDHTVFQMIIN